jgi:hypothetical protein
MHIAQINLDPSRETLERYINLKLKLKVGVFRF